MSVSEAAPAGRLAGLIALRERLALEIDGCESATAMAALSLRFMDVLVQIDELEGGSATASAPASPLDELRRKRAERSKTG